MKYDIPILTPEHARYCMAEAERRYEGRIVISKDGLMSVKDANGFCHIDEVLRGVTHWFRKRKLRNPVP